MKRLKKIAEVFIAFLIGGAFAALAFYGVQDTVEMSTAAEIQASVNVSRKLAPEEQIAVKLSRQSTVRILSLSHETGHMASSTGTYITAGGQYFVLTVMHGLLGTCEATKIWISEGFVDCIEFVYGNVPMDYAVIRVDEIEHLKPVRMPLSMPRGHGWKKALAVQTKVYYTGFPNNAGPFTFDGRIIGYTEEDFIYLDSYAWGGSSGSGVFTSDGEFIGYILAIDMGQTEFGISVLENIVIVVPAFKIDWATILKQTDVTSTDTSTDISEE
tara:strand:- start:1858 stop:2670 length:813 start_codon:yes stop_codon:yes gene_type:complete